MCELWIASVLFVVAVFLSTHEPPREDVDSKQFWTK